MHTRKASQALRLVRRGRPMTAATTPASAQESYERATRQMHLAQQELQFAAEVRDAAVTALVDSGLSYRQVADRLGLSHSRVAQMVARHRDS